jgi:hypothetical protein
VQSRPGGSTADRWATTEGVYFEREVYMQQKIMGFTLFDDKKYIDSLSNKESREKILRQLRKTRKIYALSTIIGLLLFAILFMIGLVLFIISRILLDIRMDLFSGGYGFIFLLFYFT